MPGPERAMLHQRAVLLQRQGTDPFGDPVIEGVPEELPCRWEWAGSQTQGAEGDRANADATVWLGQWLPAGSILWPGALADFPPGTGFSGDDSGLYEVMSCEGVPDVKGRAWLWRAGVQGWKQGLPPQE